MNQAQVNMEHLRGAISSALHSRIMGSWRPLTAAIKAVMHNELFCCVAALRTRQWFISGRRARSSCSHRNRHKTWLRWRMNCTPQTAP